MTNFYRNSRHRTTLKMKNNLSTENLTELMNFFKEKKKPNLHEIWELSIKLGLSHKFINSWFASQRLLILKSNKI